MSSNSYNLAEEGKSIDFESTNIKNGSMITRIYRYKVRAGCEEKYLRLQERVLALYRRLAELQRAVDA